MGVPACPIPLGREAWFGNEDTTTSVPEEFMMNGVPVLDVGGFLAELRHERRQDTLVEVSSAHNLVYPLGARLFALRVVGAVVQASIENQIF